MICILLCVPTSQSQIICCHHMFGYIWPSLHFSIFHALPFGNLLSLLCLWVLVLYSTYEWNYIVLTFFWLIYFYLAWYSQCISMLLQKAVFHFFLWLNSTIPYICTTFSLANLLSNNTFVISMSWSLWR